MKAIILARVSTKDQELFGHSLEAQVVKLMEYAKRNSFETYFPQVKNTVFQHFKIHQPV